METIPGPRRVVGGGGGAGLGRYYLNLGQCEVHRSSELRKFLN